MMNVNLKRKILFFPDLIGGEFSGARSARATLKTLMELGHEVALFSRDAENIVEYKEFENTIFYKINSEMRADSHFYDADLEKSFCKILLEFCPDYFFMLGNIQKPAILARIARMRNVKNIFLFYINDYYCAKVYAGLESGPCFKCLDNSSINALSNGCIKGEFRYVEFLKKLLVRKRLQTEILKSHMVVGYSKDQLSIYKKLGVGEAKCKKISLQFDPDELQDHPNSDGDYFIILGQPIIEKGFHVIQKILSSCKSTPKVKIVFKDAQEKSRAIQEYGLIPLIESGIITISVGLDNREDIIEVMANARAVIIPSYYPSTGEFVLIEAMLLEKPVLVFNVGAHKDFISHRINGMVSEVGDFSGFAKNIDEINADSELRNRLSKGGKEFIMNILSKENRLETMRELFA